MQHVIVDIVLYKVKKMKKQTTLTSDAPIKISDKKIVKRGTKNFFEVKSQTFEGIIDELETVHNKTKFYALFSGGKDSMTMVHKLAEMGKLEKVVHIKTNIGLQMTVDFVKNICQEHGWPLQIIEPHPQYIYASHVLEYGFPGPAFHGHIMAKLKYKTMRDFALSADRENHCLISGIRKFESQRRMKNYPHPISREGALWFGCPIFYYSTEDTYRYVHEHGLKISPGYKLGLGTSGECLCGSYATKGMKTQIRELDPKLADYIEWLEDGIQRFGTPHAKRYPKWGEQPKMTELEQQQQIDMFTKENPEFSDIDELESVICGAECGPGTMRGMVDY